MTVVSIIDHLRKKSPAHAALMRVLQSPMPNGVREGDQTAIADWILGGLWGNGFKVVSKDDDGAA
jgi:hypothetical protein